jgi:hypothetical protein
MNNTLSMINISNNNIGDEGLKVIASAVAVSKHIIMIDVGNNNITEKGIEGMFRILEEKEN